jgi:hypothetical protein
VIVPGTIIWSKAADDKSRAKAQGRLRETLQNKGLTAETKKVQSKWEDLRLRGEGQVKYLSYNSAYIFYDRYMYKYHKMDDVGEILPGDASKGTLFIPGSKPGYFPNLGGTGLTFGIEICGDHQNAALNQTVDIHILSSAMTTTITANIRARVGGLFVHAASDHTDFYVNNAGQFQSPVKATLAGSPSDLLSGKELEAERERLIKQDQQAYGSRFTENDRTRINKTFDLSVKRGQVDCWVTELN